MCTIQTDLIPLSIDLTESKKNLGKINNIFVGHFCDLDVKTIFKNIRALKKDSLGIHI